MSHLVDTCGWIEWLTDGVLAEDYMPYMHAVDEVIVPTSVQYELYKWAFRVKDKQAALDAVALTEQGIVTSLSTSIALLSAEVSAKYKLSFADAIIYATAQSQSSILVTSDDHFEGLPDVIYFSKNKRNS